jgi:hypothetical protein
MKEAGGRRKEEGGRRKEEGNHTIKGRGNAVRLDGSVAFFKNDGHNIVPVKPFSRQLKNK